MSKFDRAIKEVMQRIFLHSSLSWLGLDLKDAVFEELPLNIFQAQDREVDFLRIVSYPKRASFILHIEFQTQDDPKRHFRMAEYKAMLQRT